MEKCIWGALNLCHPSSWFMLFTNNNNLLTTQNTANNFDLCDCRLYHLIIFVMNLPKQNKKGIEKIKSKMHVQKKERSKKKKTNK